MYVNMFFQLETSVALVAVSLVSFLIFLLIARNWGQLKGRGRLGDKKKCKPTNFSLLKILYLYIKLRIYGLRVVEEIANDSDTGIFRVGLWFKSLYFVTNVDAIQKILKSNSPGHLHKPKAIYNLVFPPPLSDGLPASTLDIWTPHRKALAPVFAYKSLGIYLQYTNDCAQEMVQKIGALKDEDHEKKIRQEKASVTVGHFLIKLMTQVLMGSETSVFSNQERLAFFDNFGIVKEITVERLLNPLLVLSPVWFFHPKRKLYTACLDANYRFSNEVINRYREKGLTQEIDKTDEFQSNSTVDTLTKKTADSDVSGDDDNHTIGVKSFNCLVEQMLGAGFSNQETADEVATFLAAGHDALQRAFESLIFQLALYPEHQRKCQQEVDNLSASRASTEDPSGLNNLTMDDLLNLKYLEQCILEILRLTPTVPVFARELKDRLEMTPDWTMTRGDIVVMIPWAVHRDPVYYSNPEVFDPDRFLAENMKQRNPYSYIPFSMGVRNCIGYKLGLMIMKIYMAWLIRHFEFTTKDNPKMVKIFFNITIQPQRPYDVIYKRRVI